MVDAATKSKRIQDNQKVKDAREHGLLTSKKFEVVLSKANNEPLLTLDLLHQLVGSLASAFTSGSDNVFNPNQSVIKIIDGSRVINKRELKFNLYGLKEDDVKNPKFGEDYVSLTLYPEDVIVIVDYIRRWLVQPQCYKKELGGVSWGISASTLIDSWKTAVKRGKKDPGRKSNYIADFSLKQLKEAVDELFKQINTIYAKKTKEVKYDSIDDLLREIEQKFTEDPAGVWEKIGLVTALGIAEGAIGAQVILISNKNLRVGDARQIINAFYTQVATQLKPQEPQKPWNRILATTKEKFTSTAYLTNNENIITMSDITKVSRFIDLFNQLLKELAIEPKEVEKKIVRDETKQDEGGDTALDEPQLLNNEKIIEKVTRNLIYESGKDFLAFFANKEIDPSQLDPKQRDWLLVGLPSFISSLLEDKYTQGQLTELIQDQISKSLTQLSQEKSDFTVTSNQLADIQKLVNEQFFKQNTGDFFKWIGAVPTAVDIEKSRKKIKDKTAQAIVPPGLIDVTTPGYQTPAEIVAGLSTKRKKFYQETAIGLLGLYFSSDQTIAGFTLEDILRLHPELYDFILAFVIKELAGIPTDQLISNLRYQLFQKLVLTHEFQAQIDQLLVTKLTRQPRSFEKILIAMSRESIDEGDATASNIRQAIYHKLTTDVKFYSLVEKLEAIEPVILIKIVGTKAPTPTIPTSATSAETPAKTPAETPLAKTPAELATESSEQREKIYQQTTEALIKIYFKDEKVAGFTPQEIINLHPEFYNFVLSFVAKELAKVPTTQLSFVRPHQLFQKLVLTHEFQAQIDQLLVTKLTRQPRSFEKILIAMSREPIDKGDRTANNIRQAIYHKLTTDVKFYSLVEKLEAIEPVILIKIVGTKAPTPTIPTSATSAETPAKTPAETPLAKTPAELATESSEQREKIYQQTTEALIKIYFKDEKVAGFTPQEIINLHPEFYNFVLDFVAEELAKVPTDQLSFIRPHQLFQKLVLTHEFQAQIDQLLVTKLTRQPRSFEKILIAMSREPIDEGDATASNIRQAIYHKLTTDVKFYSLVENYSKDKLNQIGLGDAKNLNNIYNIIDSLLFLIDNPERFIQGLTADEIREYFNIEEKQVDIEALRTALLSLVALRKFHYLIASGGIKLKPLFRGEKGQQTLKSNPTHIIQVREVIKTADQRGIKEDLIVALNVNEQNIQENKKLSLSQRRLFQLRRRAWVELVAPLNYDQQLALYESYGVFFDIKTLPVPETFIFTELVAQSNLANQYYDLVDRDESLVDQDESLADQDGMTQVAPQFRKAFANQQIRKKIANNAYKALGGAIVKAVPKAAVIEKALKAMGLGKTVDDLEEKLGKAAVIAGAVITAALGGLIALIKQSLWGGLIGGAIGGVAGFVLGAGNPLIFIPSAMVGSAIGSSIGAWISKSGGAGNVFKGLFNQGTTPALQTTLGGSVGGGGLASAIPTSFPIAAIAPTAIITSTALTAVVISQTASSSLRPVMEPDIMTGQQNISQYVDIDKKTSISYLENNQPTTVTYSITITPKNSYVIGMIPDETKDVWSYLGDNPLNLPDQTEKIIEQIGIEPITSPIIISYAVEISGEDIAINNNFTFAFEVLDESGSVTDSVAAFASITIGKPDIGCFVPGEAGFSIGSGDYQLQSVAWTPEQWNRLIGLFSYRAGTSINFTKLICQSGELKIYRLPHGEFEDGGGYGGWAFSAGAIGIYDYGLSFTNASLEYTLIHELGHTLDYRNSGLRTDFLTHLHNTSCFTYPFPTRCSSDNEKSGGYEAFAEGTALYVVYQTYNFSGGKYNFKANDSDEYNWFKNNVFEIEF